MRRPARDAVRAEFVAIAARQFAATGYQGTSLSQIAREAGYSKAALLYHFRSKDELLAAVVAERLDEADSMLDQLASLPQGAERLQAVATALAGLALEHRPAGALALGPSPDLAVALAGNPELVERMNHLRQRLVHLLAGPRPTPSQHLRVGMALYGLPPALLEIPDLSAQELVAVLVDVLADAVASPAASPTRPTPTPTSEERA